MKATKDKLFTAKVDENLLKAFKHACENQDTTASQAVRAFMRDYVKKHGQAKLFDWRTQLARFLPLPLERAPHGRTTYGRAKIERLGILTKSCATPENKGLQRNEKKQQIYRIL